jgi:hypothetical protein
MKTAFWFTHDYNARSDEKIKKLIKKHGLVGYGIWWAIIEDLYNNSNELTLDYESIAYDLRTDSKIIKSIINDFDLFVFNDGTFGSNSVQRRIDERNDISIKRSESAKKRWGRDANALKNDAIESNNDAIHTYIQTDRQTYKQTF